MRPAASTCKVGTRHTGFVVKTRRSSHSNRRVKYWAKLPVGQAKPAKPKKRNTIRQANKAKKARPMLKGGLRSVRLGEPGSVHLVVDGLLWDVVYDANLVPTYATTGNEQALEQGYPFPTDGEVIGVINFAAKKGQGFDGTRYNPTNKSRVDLVNLPSRDIFQQALHELRSDV